MIVLASGSYKERMEHALGWHALPARRGLVHPQGAVPTVGDALADVARAAQRGDLAARRKLCEAIAPSLLAPIRMVLGAAHPDVEDVLQDALLGVLRALATFRGESTVLHFARRVAAKRAMDLHRRQHAAARKLENVRRGHAPDPPQTPRQAVEAERRRRHLRDLLAELPEAQADTFAMRVVLGYSLDEIAAATGAPVNTVRSRLRLAKEALRERIVDDPGTVELAEGDS
ncbi:MAG: sigma-70 family RNA polymerase sigma factor [Polyangiaceae bacterium]|nr:sigma-70 family RNA polymerase sigma factor [Polyangiaceae bacterium]